MASNAQSPSGRALTTILLAGILPLTIALAVWLTLPHLTIVNEPFHALVEITGGSMAIGVAVLLWLRLRYATTARHFGWACAALVAMGIMDAVHGALSFGFAWSWTRHAATLVGGLFFAAVWIPIPEAAWRRWKMVLVLVATSSVACAVFIWRFAPLLPTPWTAEGYTIWPKAVNAAGGVGFVFAALFLLRHYLVHQDEDDIVFAGHTLLFGVSGLLFSFSHPWAIEWWLWHGFRFVAYLVVVRSGYKIVSKLNQALHQQKENLETEVERRTKALRESENLKSAILNAALDAIITMDHKGNVADFNPAAERIFGYERGHVIGKPVADLIIPERLRQRHYEGLKRYLATGEGPVLNKRIEMPALHADGHEFPAELSISRIAGTEPPLFTATLRDTTDQKRAEEAIRQSEGLLRSFIQHAPAAIAMFDREMRYLAASNRWSQDYKLEGNLIGRSHYEVFPALPERWKEAHRRGLSGEVLKGDEDPLPREGSSTQWIQWEVRPWYLATGEIGGILIATEEVTARVLARQALAQRESVLRTVTNEARVGLVIVDKDKRYLFANQTYLEILGLPERNIVGKRVSDVMSNVYDQIKPRIDRAFAGERVAYELHVPKHPTDGGDRFYEVVYEPRIENVTEPYVVVVIVDITERRKAQEILERTVAERTAALRESNEQMEAFTYTIAHDLRAPLRAQQGFAQALLIDYGDVVGETGRDYAERIIASATRLNDLVGDLLSFSRLSRTEMKLERIDLRKIVLNTCDELTFQIRETNATVNVEPFYFRVCGNEIILRTAVENLFTNALKFRKPNIAPVIRIWAEERGNFVRLWVEDNGIGIAPEHHHQIFGVFHRLHKIGEYAGTGVGLAIVQKGIERMGGRVGLISEKDAGSRFWIELEKSE